MSAVAAALLLSAAPQPAAAAAARPATRYVPVQPRPVYVPPPPDYRAPIVSALRAHADLEQTYRSYVEAALDSNARGRQAVLDRVGTATESPLRLRDELRDADRRTARLDAIRDRLAAADAALTNVGARAAQQAAALYGRPLEDGQADADRLGADAQIAAGAGLAAIEDGAAALLDDSLGAGPAPHMAWPEAGPIVISQGWGPSDLDGEPPYQGFAHFHLGLDLARPAGTPVLAPADGVVVATGSPAGTGRYRGYGNFIVLAHQGAVETLYGHLEEVDVRAGDVVRTGQRIGLEGSTGYSSGPHLHFEVHAAGQPVDPTPYLALKP